MSENASGRVPKEEAVVSPNDPDLMAQVLKPYKENCRYLKAADLFQQVTDTGETRLYILCELGIDESCYIDDTGHFNAVEYNISFNQMMYYIIAKIIKERASSAFEEWTLEDFWKKQLPDILIVDYHAFFRRPISSSRYFGELEITDIIKRDDSSGTQPLVFVDFACRFWGENGGRARGNVRMALLNPPVPASEGSA
ncbi:FcoT family thioesterase [Streptosporangium sp. NPDC005286]|uniref:FcoT family thioesterase n=1 Tax=Streptosporangium sp. NPDC005286 TaxID=3154463 RepID=UPI00339E79FF